MENRHFAVFASLLALILLSVSGLFPQSTQAQDITVTVPEVQPNVGETVTLSIEADLGGNDVSTYSNMEFTFNSSAINIVEVRDGTELSFGSSNLTTFEKEDTLRVSNIADDSPVSGSGEFLQLDVELTQEAGIPFELSPSANPIGEPSTSVFESEEGTLLIDSINQGSVGELADAQFIHNAADPNVGTVDIYFDETLVLDDFSFRSATPFLEGLTSGVGIEVGIAPNISTGPEDIFATRTVTLTPGETHTVVANGVLDPSQFADNPDGEPIGFEFFAESGAKSTASDGEVDLRAVHGATDAPTVDIGEEGAPTLLSDLTYGDVTPNYLSATAEQKVLTVTPSGSDTPVAAFDADLSGLGGSAATVLASGFLDPSANQDGPDFALIAALPNGDVLTLEPPTAEAQLIHNAPDPAADTVDIYLDDERAVDDFAFRSATPFLEVDAAVGIDVGVAPSNSSGVEDTLASQTVTFASDEAFTVVASGVINPDLFADNPDGESIGFEFFAAPGADSTASDGEVDVRAVHGATDAPTVDIDASGTTLLDDLTYGDVTADYLSVPAEDTRLVVTPGDSETVVASFDAPLSLVDGSAATVLASGFLSPADNQDGPAFGLIAALPTGDVVELSPADVIPIQQARQQGPDSTVTVEGTVSRAFGSYVRFQDESGPTGASGLVIRQTAENDSLAQAFRDDITNGNITPGTRLQITGTLSEFSGLLQVNNQDLDSYTVQGQETPPAAQEVSLSDLQDPDGEDFESELVRVEDVSFPNPDTTGGTLDEGFTYQVENQSGTSFEYRVQDSSETAVIGAPIPQGTFTFEGVIGQFNDFSGNDEGYQFIPVRVSSGLPVELADFEAVRTGSSVELRWQTASETDNSGFRVQRETDRGWQSLGFVQSKVDGGTTSEAQSYRFQVEQNLTPGTHRFRLKQVDLDGSTSLSKVVAAEVPLQGALELTAPRPNPASGQAALSFGVKESTEATVTVYNVLGQRVKTLYRGTPQAGQTEEVEFDAGALPSGVYFVRLQADGQTQTQRLTVVR